MSTTKALYDEYCRIIEDLKPIDNAFILSHCLLIEAGYSPDITQAKISKLGDGSIAQVILPSTWRNSEHGRSLNYKMIADKTHTIKLKVVEVNNEITVVTTGSDSQSIDIKDKISDDNFDSVAQSIKKSVIDKQTAQHKTSPAPSSSTHSNPLLAHAPHPSFHPAPDYTPNGEIPPHRYPGNLMGPDHPIFNQPNPKVNPFNRNRPKFDPYNPFGTSGEPDNDHMPFP